MESLVGYVMCIGRGWNRFGSVYRHISPYSNAWNSLHSNPIANTGLELHTLCYPQDVHESLPNIPKQIITAPTKTSRRLGSRTRGVHPTSTSSDGTSMAPAPKLLVLLHGKPTRIPGLRRRGCHVAPAGIEGCLHRWRRSGLEGARTRTRRTRLHRCSGGLGCRVRRRPRIIRTPGIHIIEAGEVRGLRQRRGRSWRCLFGRLGREVEGVAGGVG